MNHFFAIPIPPAIQEELGKLAGEWRRIASGRSSWYDPVDYHITLKFLGDVDPSHQPELIAAALPVAAQMEPFTVDLNASPGAFPSLRAPQVLWAGVEPSEPMSLLAGCLESAMEPLGFRRERRPFKPHITLARCRDIMRGPETSRGRRAETRVSRAETSSAPTSGVGGYTGASWPAPAARAFPVFTADCFVLMQTLSQKDRQIGENAKKARYNTVRTFPFGVIDKI